MKKFSVLFAVLTFISTTFAQEVVKQKAPLRTDEGNTVSQSYVPSGNNSPVTAANYVAVDTMANSFGPAANTLNPLAYDPISKVLAVVHRGKSPYAVSSGELWWNYSTDLGISWHRSNTSVQNGTLSQNSARYPNMTLANYTNSINMTDLLGAFSWPELSTTGLGWLGYGVSEGLLQSAFANLEQGPPTYGSNVPTFSDNSWIFWCADNLSDNSIRLWRTQDYSTVEVIDPPTWGTTRWTNGNILLGGVSHNGVVYVGVIGSYTEEIGAGGWEIGYSKSTDHGATWSDWFVPDWRTIPGLTNFTELWDWKVGDTYVSYSGDIQVDDNGNVHFVTGLTDSVILQNAIVEIYETAPNVWAGKVITVAHDNSKYGYEDNTPGLGQTGPSIMMAANKNRDFFAVQYSIGSPETQDSLCDLYVHTRALSDANWSGSTNLTETNTMNEDGCHLAPYIASNTSADYIFSMFWYEQGNTTPTIDQTAPSVIWVAPYAVRSAGGDIPITFQVDMSVQMFEGNFPPGANVVVRGDFQTDAGDPNGLWQGNMFQLSDTDDDSIYTGTFQIPSNFVGNNYIFKYVIVNPPAGDNWESINNRPFTLTSPETVIPLDCFNHDCPVVYNPVTNTIIFTADISGILGVGIGGAFDPNQDSLLVMGLDWGLDGWNVIGNRKLENADPFHPGIYTTTLMVTSFIGATGEGDSTEWIFRAFPGSRFEDLGWESNIDRWYVYGPDSITNSLPTIIPQIAPNFQVSTNPIDFTLNVDMTGAVNRHNGEPIPLDSIEFVIVTGTTQFLGSYYHNPSPCYCIDDTAFGYIKALTHISENIWSYHTTIPIGQHCGIFGYKFGVIYPGSDTISSGFNSLMNELPYGVYHNILLTGLQNTLVINNWFGYPVPPDNVEQIENLIPDRFIF
ncbi:MAG: hypothetical protein IPI19_12055 [Ignavibacteriales bacterium]|nr:hypothetical protein [Ignavibacteriales bacterium]